MVLGLGGPFVAACGSQTSPSKGRSTRASTTVVPSTTVEQRLSIPLPGYFERGPGGRPLVAVTLDDVFGADGAQNLAALLPVLDDAHIRMTIFPTGSALKQHLDAGLTQVWRDALNADLIEIGSHGYTENVNINSDLTRLSNQQITTELTTTQALLDQVLGYHYPMRLLRPPGGFGRGNARLISFVNSLGYSLVGWDIGGDNATPGPDYASAIITRKPTTNGSIVLSDFTTLRVIDYGPLFTNLRTIKGLEPTTVTGLFQPS
jgi:peptidoglycan/xylan/chitin deacetylase (PgdA/CDA1 family)